MCMCDRWMRRQCFNVAIMDTRHNIEIAAHADRYAVWLQLYGTIHIGMVTRDWNVVATEQINAIVLKHFFWHDIWCKH